MYCQHELRNFFCLEFAKLYNTLRGMAAVERVCQFLLLWERDSVAQNCAEGRASRNRKRESKVPNAA